jgi:predicted nucleic-acid-binding protein
VRAVDTNVLVRLLARDDPKQLAAAESFVAAGAWVSHLVLMETAWVLESVYGVSHAGIAKGLVMLLEHEAIAVQDADVVAEALVHYRRHPALGFSDCLVLEVARKAGHLPLGTFDRKLARLDGAQKL